MHLSVTSNILPDDRVVIFATGELDVSSSTILKSELTDHIAQGRAHVIIDLSKVTFVDSSGLSVLVTGLKRTVEGGGFLRLVVTAESVMRIFQITALDQAFDIFADLETALSA